MLLNTHPRSNSSEGMILAFRDEIAIDLAFLLLLVLVVLVIRVSWHSLPPRKD
jgi:hypothetical protein